MKLDPLAIDEGRLKLFPNPDFWQDELLMPIQSIPVICLECDQPVNLLHLKIHPVLLESVREEAYEWAVQFFAIQLLDRKPYDEWAEVQLLDVQSPLNLMGQTIRELLDNARPCYYHVHWRTFDLKSCPRCHQAFTPYHSAHREKPVYLCQSCRFVYEG